MGERAPVSCYIRTFNEERKIGEVLAAVRDVVGEIVVVDTGSKDATVAIAQSQGARVIHQDWLGPGRQKRFAEDQCRNDFLLDLDADEIVSPELGAEIRGLFAEGPPPFPIYELRLVIVPPVGKPWGGMSRLPIGGNSMTGGLCVSRITRLGTSSNRRRERGWADYPGLLMHHAFRDLEHMMDKLNAVSSVRAKKTRQHRGRLRGVGSRVLFAFPFYFLKRCWLRGYFRLGVYGVATGRNPGVRPLAARCEDVRAHNLLRGREERAADAEPVRPLAPTPV